MVLGPPSSVAGYWSFLAQSSIYTVLNCQSGGCTTVPAQFSAAGTLNQNGNSFSGTLTISGSPCVSSANMTGSISVNSLNASLNEGGQIVMFTGTITGSSASGNYVTPAGGCTNGDYGVWTATRSTSQPTPSISPGGIVPLDSSANTIQPGEWVSVFGTNLANSTVSWTGNFPASLGGTSVQINGKVAYLSYVSSGQINLQTPDDTALGTVPVVVTTANGSTTSTVTLDRFAPSFALLDTKHVAGIIPRSDGSGAYGGGTYDILGPTGSSLGYATVAAKAGDTVELFGVGFGPTNPAVPAGQAFSGAAPATNPVNLLINNVSVTPSFAGLSSAGLYQINLAVPAGLGPGDVPLVATVGGVETQSSVLISLQ